MTTFFSITFIVNPITKSATSVAQTGLSYVPEIVMGVTEYFKPKEENLREYRPEDDAEAMEHLEQSIDEMHKVNHEKWNSRR
ncbi:hypothetical protein SNEBB_004216 [Seison nebaliae]|nr:hypothetical protein SNEBB_004216 [Seison nebaliae]